ncbi:MAG TPA: hypothetical protein VL588_01505 [Bdellovibrionota bacterium]|nr:hypothetical protein [Bdellovibrionota bacterium]
MELFRKAKSVAGSVLALMVLTVAVTAHADTDDEIALRLRGGNASDGDVALLGLLSLLAGSGSHVPTPPHEDRRSSDADRVPDGTCGVTPDGRGLCTTDLTQILPMCIEPSSVDSGR